MGPYTSFLYAEPSAVEGVGRVLDLGATFDEYNYSDSPDEAVERAMYADWCATRDDLRAAAKKVIQNHKAKLRLRNNE